MTDRLFRILLVLLAFSPLVATAAPVDKLPGGVTRGPTVEGISEYDLANGLRVLFAADPSKPTTTVNTTYLVGSRNENYGETGMAHLLEHLTFKGTPRFPMVWNEYTRRGMRANGSTWTDRTNYFASFAANEDNLDWYLRWSADAMTNSFIAKKDLDSEMTVVRNELEMGENDPFRSLLESTMATAYTWHAYGKSTIGARSDVENVNIEHLQAFYRKYYQPDNAVLIIAGRFDEAKTLALIADTFGKIPRPQRVLEPTYTLDREQQGERSVTLRRVGDTQLVLAAYHIPAAASPDFAAMDLLADILGDTPTGRLHKALVESKQAASVFGFTFPFKEPSLAFFGARLPNDASIETAKATLLATVENMAKQPVTEAEVDRARARYLKDFELRASDPEKVGVALSSAIAVGDWRLFFLERDRVRAAKAADVQRVATAYLLPDNRTLGLFLPTTKPSRAPAPAFVDVAPMVKDYRGDPAIAAGEAFEATPENIEARAQRSTLPNGMKLAMVPKRTRGSTVTATLILRLGNEKELFDTRSTGFATGAMLSRGAGGLTRQEIQDRFDKLKARVGFSGGPTAMSVGIETVRENFPEVLKLVATVLRKPTFPESEFEQLRNEWMTGIEAQRKEPNALARLAVARHGNPYPRGDIRYEEDFDEQVVDLKALTLQQVKAFHAKFYGAQSADFAAVGDFDPVATEGLLKELFGDWKSASPYVRVPRPNYAVMPTLMKLETPDKANAVFMAQLRFPLKDDQPDYPALLVANHIVGGGTASLLWKRIREKDGLSYGVNSGIGVSSHEPSATWTASAIYAPQNLSRLQAAFQEVVARAVKDGFTAEQLQDAKSGILQARRLARAQDGALAATLASQLEVGRTMAFSAEIDAKIEALTLDQANAALRKYVDPEKLVTAVAGDFGKTTAAK
jgi:zinc protease